MLNLGIFARRCEVQLTSDCNVPACLVIQACKCFFVAALPWRNAGYLADAPLDAGASAATIDTSAKGGKQQELL